MSEAGEQSSAQQGELGIPNLMEAIEKLKAHPEIISMAASVLGGTPDEGNAASEEKENAPKKEKAAADGSSMNGAPPPDLDGLASLLAPLLRGKGCKDTGGRKRLAKSAALLIALKPYLSSSRCETVDRLVELQRIGELFEGLS